MISPGRPTWRLLKDDLNADWNEAEDRDAVERGLHAVHKPLHALDHPTLRKLTSDFTIDASTSTDVKREGITDLTNPMWWKRKIGRWRGAVYQDDNGQAWLCAAGYRRGKESTDFYQAFMAAVNAHGPDKFLPTAADRERLADELSQNDFEVWERWLQETARATVFAARADGLASCELADPDGRVFGEMSVAISEENIDELETVTDVVFEFVCSDYELYELLEWAEMVMCLAVDAREQSWRPTSITNGRAYSFLLESDDATSFYREMEQPAGPPGVSIPGAEAHWAHRARLTESTIMGEAVKGLCGRWFVPRQDHADKPACKQCEAVHGRLAPGPAPLGEPPKG